MVRMRRLPNDDQGFGLVLVMGIVLFVSTLVVTATGIAVHSISQSRQRQVYEQALAVAESGIDFGLANLQQAFDTYNADFPVPSQPTLAEPSPVCQQNAVTRPSSATVSADAERSWAKSTIASLPDSCLQTTSGGQFMLLKPTTPLVNGAYPKYGTVYSMGWVPSKAAANARWRLVKTDYLFMPYRPLNAILTGGSVVLDSSTTVTSAYGVAPTLAGVHANGTVSVSGNPTVTGTVSSTGTSSASSNNFTANSGGSVTQSSLQRVPKVSALSLYYQAQGNDPTAVARWWYDLCDDGSVRSYAGTAGPCAGSKLNDDGSGGNVLPYRGWSYDSSHHTWIASSSALDGVYFVHYGNVDVGPGNGTFANFSVIAQAKNQTNCSSKQYGSINWNHFGLQAPAYHNLWFYADTDLVTHSNFFAGSGTTTAPVVSGMFVAGDQVQLETSSQGAVGSVVAADQCTSPAMGSNPNTPQLPGEGYVTTNEIKNPAIYYDPNSDAPFTSLIDTTLWLEYVG